MSLGLLAFLAISAGASEAVPAGTQSAEAAEQSVDLGSVSVSAAGSWGEEPLSEAEGEQAEGVNGAEGLEAEAIGGVEKLARTHYVFHFDNDLFSPPTTDRDYTFGVALLATSKDPERLPFSLAGWLPAANREREGPKGYVDEAHGVEVGVIAFTPDDIRVRLPPVGERPFASLVYVGHSRHRLSADRKRMDAVSLTLGALGLDLAEELQEEVHFLIDYDQPEGWDSQISSGGEPTAMLAYDRRFLLVDAPAGPNSKVQLARSFGVSLGYLSEASLGWSGRIGRFGDSRWWEFSFSGPSGYGVRAIQGERAEKPAPKRAAYVFGEFRLRARFYNAFLQGQFRDSPLTYNRSELREMLGEITAGFVVELPHRWSVSYVIRVQTSEIAQGEADRISTWGSLVVTRAFR
ncbi:MAG: lipid A deacylase LpxR family protein [Acidobacteriota bacterium]